MVGKLRMHNQNNQILVDYNNKDIVIVSIKINLSTIMQQVNINWNEVTPDQIANLILETLSGNNDKIKYATKMLKAYTKQNSSIRVLSYLLVASDNVSVRQMATVLLKRNITNVYQNLNPQQQSQFRNVLLSQFVRQPSVPVQKGIVLLIGLLVPIVELDKWGELKQLLENAIKSAPQSLATFLLLNNLLYHFKPPPQLYNYLIAALSNHKLAEQAMNCLVAVAETQDIDQTVAVKLIQLWQTSNWSQEVSLICFQVLNIMCERKIKLAEDIIKWICDKIVSNKKLTSKLRNAGLDFLFTYIEYNGKQLSNKQPLLKTIVECVCLTCSQPQHQHHEDQEQATQQIALWLIETLSATIKSKKIYPILLQASMLLIKSQNQDQMNTGFLVLASMSEGCSDRVKKNLQNPIMNVLIPKGLTHTAPKVRGAAINALCYFSQFLIPDIVEYHSTIIPSMVNYMDDLSAKVGEKSIIAIDVFFESMEEQEINKYLPLVIPKLIEILLRNNSTALMRKYAMSAIGSAIIASGESFQPYVDGLFKTCLQFLKLHPSPQLNTVRAENISLIGRLTNVFCKKSYSKQSIFFHSFIMPILEGIYNMLVSQKDPEIRQACFSFFYLLANAIEGDFQFIFDKILAQVLKGCQMKTPQKNKNQVSLDSDSEDDEALPSYSATEYDEKAAAIHALGQLAKACPMQFQPYFERAFQILQENYQFFYESVRRQVAITYEHLTVGLIKSQYQGVIPPFKKGLPCISRYHQKLQLFFKTELIPKLIFIIGEDDSVRVSSVAIEALHDLIKEIGPVLVDHSLEPIRETITKLLEKSTLEDSQEEEQQEDDTEVETFEAICDLIPMLADVLQGGFEPTLNQLYPYIMRFTQERDDINDNIQIVGCLSQCFKHVPGFVASHSSELFLSINDLVGLNDTDLNRNIAYSFAEMFDKNPNCMKAHLQDALISLKNIFEREDSSDACKDNAMAALCRITYRLFPMMPYDAFVSSLLTRMPFSGDQEQQPSAIKAIIYLSTHKPQAIAPHLKTIQNIFIQDLQNSKKYNIDGDLAMEMQSLMKNIE